MFNLSLTDTRNQSKINSLTSYSNLMDYLQKRELGKHGGTVVFLMDGNVAINATDKKNHVITGTATKIKNT